MYVHYVDFYFPVTEGLYAVQAVVDVSIYNIELKSLIIETLIKLFELLTRGF